MTVAELIAALVEIDHSDYLVDARCTPLFGNIVPPGSDAHDSEDRTVLGVLSVIQDRRPAGHAGWVTLELDGPG